MNKTIFVVCNAFCILTACSGEDSDIEQKPEYTTPSYATPEPNSIASKIHFTDITSESGIVFTHETGAFEKKWMPETMGSGGGFLDYDNDGLPDILLVNSTFWAGHERNSHRPTSRLYRNLGAGRFRDVSHEAGLDVSIYGMGCTSADYDADGDIDIYLTAVGDNRLLRNDNGTFKDVTQRAGVTGNSSIPGDPPAWSTSAAWLDVDRDGWLDLFVCNYVKWTPETDLFTTLDGKNKSYATPEQYQGQTCRLYRNVNANRFEDITKKAGVYNPAGKSLGVAVADFNDDGWPDIVVANDTQPNFLYLNTGEGAFTDIALKAGVGYDEYGRARAGMGIDVADLWNDGNLTIGIGNFSREPLSLYTQIGTELFQDLAGRARLTKPSIIPLTFGLLFVDLNLDGYQDLIVGNGHIEPEINSVQQEITFAQKPQIFKNLGNGQFADASANAGPTFSEPIVARGVAAGDIDDDGDPDLLITTNGGPPKLLRNDLSPTHAHWLKFRFIGNAPNLDAVGAKVTVWTGEFKQKKMIRTGSSYLSQSDFRELIFGLGSHKQADSLQIRWPTSGKVDSFGPAPSGQTYLVQETPPRLVIADSSRH
ncbi:CRTAC1 family protein [candidate division KSB1 bacterium]|nr:CRTAC1 family protein [candidate division KSB1 bacterium]NIR71221.1 CRTAC1 family protein [candidate division KSB1 bacterium]NIS27595.1 CRTAC1 family protein [candidate division KSB1 bacterium]NIT72946.1 CRTAC1 family protein [candidate division KSB1 bacterium]NIU28312.1 CRTAC1 family protein [candidate division KSB1 bacterium]